MMHLEQNRTQSYFDRLPPSCSALIAHYIKPWEPSNPSMLAEVLCVNPLRHKRVHLKFSARVSSEIIEIAGVLKRSSDTLELTLEFLAEVFQELVDLSLQQSNIVSFTLVCAALSVPDSVELLPKFIWSRNKAHSLRLFYDAGAKDDQQVCRSISTLLANDTALIYLEVYGSKLRGREFEAALERTKVKCLILSDETIDRETTWQFANVLASSNHLMLLRLSYSSLGDAAVRALAESLKVNKGLKKLSLMSVGITAKGAQALADMLIQNSTLLELYLSDDPIGDEGGIALAHALRRNKSLRILLVDFAHIGNSCGRHLAESLRHNKALTQLYLEGNEFSDDTKNLLVESAKANAVMDVLRVGLLNLLENKPPYRLYNTVDMVFPDGECPMPNVAYFYQMVLDLHEAS